MGVSSRVIDGFESTARLTVAELKHTLENGDPQQRVWCAWRLGLVLGGDANGILRDQAKCAPDAGTRRHLAVVLASLAAYDILEALAFHDPAPLVRADAAALLWRCAGESRLAALLRLFESDPTDAVRARILSMDPALPDHESRTLVALAMKNGSSELRWAALERQERLDGPLSEAVKFAASRDPVPDLRKRLFTLWAVRDGHELLHKAVEFDAPTRDVVFAILQQQGSKFCWSELRALVGRLGWDYATLSLLEGPYNVEGVESLLATQRLDLPLAERAELASLTLWKIVPHLQQAHAEGVTSQLSEHFQRLLSELEDRVRRDDAELDPGAESFDPEWDPHAGDRAVLAALGRDPGRADLFQIDVDFGDTNDAFHLARGAARCANCADPWRLYTTTAPLAVNLEQHSALLQCPECDALYEVEPEGRAEPRLIDQELASAIFSGWPEATAPSRTGDE